MTMIVVIGDTLLGAWTQSENNHYEPEFFSHTYREERMTRSG